MKIFKVTSYFEIENKPEELIKFEELFGRTSSRYHITYKFPTYVKSESLGKLTEVLKQTSVATKPFDLTFDKYFFDKVYSGNIVLLTSSNSTKIKDFQKKLVEGLHKFGLNIHTEEVRFETHFLPHLTLARKIDDKNLEAVKSSLPSNLQLSAKIESFTLTLADEWTKTSKKEEFLFPFQTG